MVYRERTTVTTTCGPCTKKKPASCTVKQCRKEEGTCTCTVIPCSDFSQGNQLFVFDALEAPMVMLSTENVSTIIDKWQRFPGVIQRLLVSEKAKMTHEQIMKVVQMYGDNKDVMHSLVTHNGHALEHLPEKWRRDVDIVHAAGVSDPLSKDLRSFAHNCISAMQVVPNDTLSAAEKELNDYAATLEPLPTSAQRAKLVELEDKCAEMKQPVVQTATAIVYNPDGTQTTFIGRGKQFELNELHSMIAGEHGPQYFEMLTETYELVPRILATNQKVDTVAGFYCIVQEDGRRNYPDKNGQVGYNNPAYPDMDPHGPVAVIAARFFK